MLQTLVEYGCLTKNVPNKSARCTTLMPGK